jgi:hypothetical protein
VKLETLKAVRAATQEQGRPLVDRLTDPVPPPGTKRRWLKLLRVLWLMAPLGIVIGALLLAFKVTVANLARLNYYSPAMSGPTMKENFRPLPRHIKVEVLLVPQKDQRYPTLGDWLWKGKRLTIRLSREIAEKDPRYGMLLLTHELIEALLCQMAGISTRQVDKFDIAFTGDGEPGDDPAAPYHREHRWAEGAERALAKELGVKWRNYASAFGTIGTGADQGG